MMFASFDEATKALLVSVCRSLNESTTRYVIVGGWVPVLRGRGGTDLPHPGTRDVDILLNDDMRVVRSAFERILRAGFVPSAKHEFQLLRELSVAGRPFVFNIDLLHPGEEGNTTIEFNKIFDFGVPDPTDPSGNRWAKSIIFPAAKLIFERSMFSDVDVVGRDVDGVERKTKVPLLLESGAYFVKMQESAKQQAPARLF